MSIFESVLTAEFWARVATITLIDIMLAGDNALVIALAVRSLPKRQRLLGQLFGTMGAVILRVLLIAVATAILNVPLLRAAGGVLLVWIAVKLVQPAGEETTRTVREARSLRSAVGIIVVADLVMSLDNVIGVAGAAHGDMRLVVFGIALSIPIIVTGSGILARLMGRFPWIVWGGGGVLGYVAGEMIAADTIVARWLTGGTRAAGLLLSAALAVAIIALGWWKARHPKLRAKQRDRRRHHDARPDAPLAADLARDRRD